MHTKALRAAQVAKQEKIPFATAKEMVTVSSSIRPDLGETLSGSKEKRAGDVTHLGEALGHAQREMDSMLESARSLTGALNDPNAMNEVVARGSSSWYDVKYGEEQSTKGNFSRTAADGSSIKPTYSNKQMEQQSFPGRKVFSHQARKGWMYIDSWHTVGPFDNRHLADRHPVLTEWGLCASIL